MAVTTNGHRITSDDLQAAYARVAGEGEASAKASAPSAAVIAGAVVLVVVTLAFLAGKRRGRSRSAIIELRRV